MSSQQDREARIRESAYYRYLQHGSDGHDLEDWLAAEAEFDAAARSELPTLRLKTRRTAAAVAAVVTGEKPKRATVKAAPRKPGSRGKSATSPDASR